MSETRVPLYDMFSNEPGASDSRRGSVPAFTPVGGRTTPPGPTRRIEAGFSPPIALEKLPGSEYWFGVDIASPGASETVVFAFHFQQRDAVTLTDIVDIMGKPEQEVLRGLTDFPVRQVGIIYGENNPYRNGGEDDGSRSSIWNAQEAARYLAQNGVKVVF